jgi:hypothetical protein
MPLQWRIDHERCRVTATLLNATGEQELYEFLGEVIAQNAMRYPKLFDASAATKWITPGRIGPIAATARLYGRMGLGPIGPLAIVVADQRANRRAQEYEVVSDADRRVRIFRQVQEAEEWLASQDRDESRD